MDLESIRGGEDFVEALVQEAELPGEGSLPAPRAQGRAPGGRRAPIS
jgi:hypothetical protein